MLRTASGLFVPPRIARQEVEQSEAHKAEVMQMVQRFEGTMRHWTETIQRELNDDRLEVIFAPPTVDPETGLTPGRYHVLRRNEPPTPPTLIPLEGLRGEFVEPGTWVIEKLRKSDLQNPRVVRAAQEKTRREKLAKEREAQRDQEDRKEHLRDAYRARFETSVSLNTDTPWTQNAAGRRGRKAA